VSSMQFHADVDDIRFVLFEQLKIQDDLAKIEGLADFDQETIETMMEEAYRLATDVLAPINGPGDRAGCTLDDEGNVSTPAGFDAAWRAMAEGGWIGVNAPVDAGGLGGPSTMAMIANDFFSGAAMAFQMYPGLSAAAARVIYQFGPAGKSVEYAEKMFAGEWGGTMCLTEAGAGSSVGDNRCKATPADDNGLYHLEGEKIFISGGDHDLAENIVHLVLARTPNSPKGTKGLSLFLVPKYRVNDDMSNGERNGAFVVGLEHKMGINGSATCTLALGDRKPCHAWLVGKEHEGITIMFHMMNEARIGVGAQAIAVAASAYEYALAYCRERVQGQAISDFGNPEAPPVTINQHPDVRRMLMTMKCQVEAMRSMLYRLAHRFDLGRRTEDEAERLKAFNRVELLTPILKSHCSDVGYDISVMALQCFGGYGYIGEYPIEQVVRDMKITSIYEGTNGIQAMDLIGRKLRQKNGALFMEWMQDALSFLGSAAEEGFEDEAANLTKSVNALAATAMHLSGLGMKGNLPGVFVQASPFQKMFGYVHLGLESLEQARVAKRLMAESGETVHLKSKQLNVKFYVANILPQAIALGKSIQVGDESCLDDSLFA
jgi:alkylation response protein AidB-like acyl-CoA dehydrogenase